MSRRRFFVPAFEGQVATLAGEQVHHLGRVLRARPGQLYELSDGRQLWLARIRRVERQSIAFELVEEIPVRVSALEIILLAAVVKFARMEWYLEKATELGVTEILPIAARRSDPRLVEAAARRRARWEKILREAAEQARRLPLPVLRDPARLPAAVASLDADLKILLSESPDAPPLKSVLRAVPCARRVALAIGPEGGWTAEELRAARAAGFQAASLGPIILRSETAVLAALAAVDYELA